MKGRAVKTAAIVIAVLVVLFLGFGALFGDKEKAKARDAIDFCWKEQGRKSFSAAEAQFVAGACERMEDDFLKKYGHKP